MFNIVFARNQNHRISFETWADSGRYTCGHDARAQLTVAALQRRKCAVGILCVVY